MTIELLSASGKKTAGRLGPLTPHWVEKDAEAKKAARSDDKNSVWIIRNLKLLDQLVRGISWPSRTTGYLVLLNTPRPELLGMLMRRFERVAYADHIGHFLPREEMNEAFKAQDREDRFVGGIVDKQTQTITLWRGDLSAIVIPFLAIQPTANGIKPEWNHFSVTDYGHTLRFGDYEAASDAVLYEYDEDFRRRQNIRRRATETTLGASIRRLRKQRGLTRNDFPGVDPKTLGRIERSEVAKPQSKTLSVIANLLGVEQSKLSTF